MRIVFLLALILCSLPAYLQKPLSRPIPLEFKRHVQFNSPASVEICNNNIDDDGNGLVDCKDFGCYFRQGDPQCACYPMNLIWICDAGANLYWVDVETQTEKKVGYMQFLMGDIAWTPQGKLYGTSGSDIHEINPSTGQVNWVASITGYSGSNALVSDAAGNLFMNGIANGFTGEYILKYNMYNGQLLQIANISAAGVSSAGDLAFAGGMLYLACSGNKIAKIDPTSGAIQVRNISGLPLSTQIYGIVSVGGGKLFLSDANQLYSLDTTSFQATHEYTCTSPGLVSYGMANYNDFCNAPRICNATVNINSLSGPPFCQQTGVILKAEGSGINGQTAYTWWKPDGTQTNSQIIMATESGKYSVRFHTVPDTCEAWATISINLLPPPQVDLGADTYLCEGSQVTLEAKNNDAIISWLWSNGSTAQRILVNQSGSYWLQVSNGCGVARDTIHLTGINFPLVNLGNDFAICQDEAVYLTNKNSRHAGDSYLWSNGSTSDSIRLKKAGTYWLEVYNSCGRLRDSVVVNPKDSCICKPLYPAVELGRDRELCKFDTLVLINFSDASSFRYLWNDGSNEKLLVVDTPGRYWVRVSTYCGEVADTIMITEKRNGCECKVFIPNAFSPFSYSRNQKFRISSTCLLKGQFSIYNRWGQLVYQTADPYVGWDGRFNGIVQPAGTYVYQLTYQFNNRKGKFAEKGTFILVR